MLIRAVAGHHVSFTSMEKYVQAQWVGMQQLAIWLIAKGVFVFRFHSNVDMEKILNGSWMLNGVHPLVFRQWAPGVKLDSGSLDRMTSGLPSGIWTFNFDMHIC